MRSYGGYVLPLVVTVYTGYLLYIGTQGENLLPQLVYPGLVFVLLTSVGWMIHPHLRKYVHKFVVPDASSGKNDDTKKVTGVITMLFLVGAGMIFGLLLIDFYVHRNLPPFKGISSAKLGPFGDFFGGVLNPILTFISFIALAFSFTLQKLQVRDSREQAIESSKVAQNQMFDSTFFNMMNLHGSTADELRYWYKKVNVKGAATIAENDRKFQVGEEEDGRAVFGAVLATMFNKSQNPSPLFVHEEEELLPTPAGVYKVIQDEHNYVLGHYFRNLFQVLSYIRSHAPRLDDVEIKEDKEEPSRRYSKILRAQLSADELVVLFFNCQGTLVDDGKFRRLLVRYEMLEHIPIEFDAGKNKLMVRRYGFELDITGYVMRMSDGTVVNAFGRNKQATEYLRLNPSEIKPFDGQPAEEWEVK